MVKVCTLQDIKSMESKKIQGQGYRLGSTHEQELEKALHNSIKSNSEITSEYKNMQVAKLSVLNSILVSKNSELGHMKNTLASKDDELKQIKDNLVLKTSEIYSLESKLLSVPIKIGGEADEKKISNSILWNDDAIASDIHT
ncbi:3856_t:CDS:2 [Acaulospora morrowiae]|uniref:3856_t:CDS:1 n=1 Tax=Acaulospora morrowiae TaxID=94023 RepID=A0A9N9D2Y0_9GLOM|nr:3856_t:CDS:2 [Acaulospora morrowiae]